MVAHPLDGCHSVLDGCRERALGREAVVREHHERTRPLGDEAHLVVVDALGASREAASVKEDEDPGAGGS